jgi:hypothetical protein
MPRIFFIYLCCLRRYLLWGLNNENLTLFINYYLFNIIQILSSKNLIAEFILIFNIIYIKSMLLNLI